MLDLGLSLIGVCVVVLCCVRCACRVPQMEKKKQENKMRRDQLNDEHLELLDKQRLYFKTVKDFKEVTSHCCPAEGQGFCEAL